MGTNMITLSDINWWAVLLAACGYYVLGALWFTPLFGRAWDRSIGYDRAAGTGRFPPAYYVVPLIGAAIGTLVVAVFTALIDPVLIAPGALVGSAAVGLGIGVAIAGATLTNALTPHTPKPYLFAAITAGYHVVGCTLVGVILGAFAG